MPVAHRPAETRPSGRPGRARLRARLLFAALAPVLGPVLILVLLMAGPLAGARPAAAQGPQPPPIPEITVPTPAQPSPGQPASGGSGVEPVQPVAPVGSTATPTNGNISINVGTPGQGASQSVLLIVGLAVLSLAPSLVLMLSSFTRIIIVFSLTRNALGLQGIPPNQVLVGLALFLSLFVMGPTLRSVDSEALQPYLHGTISQSEAYHRATGPVHGFMLAQTRTSELQLMIDASGEDKPATPDEVSMTTLIPAFLLSELKTAFIMGFVIFIPFLIIDIVVAAVLMALGMMMLPPVFVSLPFKLLLFVMVGGWSLIVSTLLTSFRT